MILVFENLCEYDDATYLSHLVSLPLWRREYALRYKQESDRKRSVLAYKLLCKAAEKKFGICDIPQFSYNENGKPYFKDTPFFFSISHGKNAVACGVSENEIGIDIQNISSCNEKVAEKMGFISQLPEGKDRDLIFTRLWTEREAISKFDGKGIALSFSEIRPEEYQMFTLLKSDYVLSACFGRKEEKTAPPQIEYISIKEI